MSPASRDISDINGLVFLLRREFIRQRITNGVIEPEEHDEHKVVHSGCACLCRSIFRNLLRENPELTSIEVAKIERHILSVHSCCQRHTVNLTMT